MSEHTCPYCGGELYVTEDEPWSDGTKCWIILHKDMKAAVRALCPMLQPDFRTKDDALAVLESYVPPVIRGYDCKWFRRNATTDCRPNFCTFLGMDMEDDECFCCWAAREGA